MNLIKTRIRIRIYNKKDRLDNYMRTNIDRVNYLKTDLLIRYTYNSNALENNELTLQETRSIIEEFTIR